MIWSLSLHQGGKKTHKNRTSHATTLFLVFSKIVETNSQNDEHSAPKLRVTNTAGVRDNKKPLGINLHMVPSQEIRAGLHYLELTSLHHSVAN